MIQNARSAHAPGPGPAPTCTPVTREYCGKSLSNSCLKCGKAGAFDCEECCPGCTQVTKGDSKYCSCGGKPGPSHSGYSIPYKTSNFHPGQRSDVCKTGVQARGLPTEGS